MSLKQPLKSINKKYLNKLFTDLWTYHTPYLSCRGNGPPLFRISWDNLFSWTILWMLWALPNCTPSTAYSTICCAIIHLTNSNFLKWRPFINISQISFTFWVSAANFHCLEIPAKVLSALIHNLYWKTTIGANSGSPVLIRGSLSDMFSMQKFKTLLCIFRDVKLVNYVPYVLSPKLVL